MEKMKLLLILFTRSWEHFFPRLLLNKLLFVMMAWSLVGCAIDSRKLDKDVNYEKDLKLQVSYLVDDKWQEPKTYYGVATLPQSSAYKIKVWAPDGRKIDMLTWTTCHDDEKIRRPGSDWFSSGYEFIYEPDPGLEQHKPCAMEIGVYDEDGEHGWGTLEFESRYNTLPAYVKCSGARYEANGVAICQAKEGLIQALQFKSRVDYEPSDPACEMTPNDRGNYFEWIQPKGNCTVYFADALDDQKLFRLTLYGYDVIPVRKYGSDVKVDEKKRFIKRRKPIFRRR